MVEKTLIEKKAWYEKHLKSIQKKIDFEEDAKVIVPPKDYKTLVIEGLLGTADDAGQVGAQTGEKITQASFISSPLSSNGLIQLGMAGSNFVRIPLSYMIAYLSNKKVPFTLSNNAKWAYSAGILGLLIAAFVIPAAAIVIGLVLAGMGVAAGLVVAVKAIRERQQLSLAFEAFEEQRQALESEMEAIQRQGQYLENLMASSKSPEEQLALFKQVDELIVQYKDARERLAYLDQEKAVLKDKSNELSFLTLINRGVALAAASAIGIGMIIGLFVPPLGAAIILAVSLVTGAYAAATILISAVQWIKSVLSPAKPIDVQDIELDDMDVDMQLANAEPVNNVVNDSTKTILSSLSVGGEQPTHEEDLALDEEIKGVEKPKSIPMQEFSPSEEITERTSSKL